MANDSVIRAAGALAWRYDDHRNVQVALVHRPRYKDWSLPKGKATAGETMAATAARELVEETGFAGAIGRALTQVHYTVAGRPKVVQYYAATCLGGSFSPNKEVDELAWLSLADAAEQMTYEFDHAVLTSFSAHPPSLATVIAARHARAGSRDSFSGPDARRPLDSKGEKQAAQLVGHLTPFRPTAVFAAPLRRCVDTVAPLAGALGLSIQLESAFTEETFRDRPSVPRKKIAELAAAAASGGEPGSVIVCSQGGVIPGVVKALAARGDVWLKKTSTPKASFWVLSFDGSHLVQADHHEAPDV